MGNASIFAGIVWLASSLLGFVAIRSMLRSRLSALNTWILAGATFGSVALVWVSGWPPLFALAIGVVLSVATAVSMSLNRVFGEFVTRLGQAPASVPSWLRIATIAYSALMLTLFAWLMTRR